MSNFIKELDARRARFEMLQTAMREFEDRTKEKYPEGGYAYISGFLSSQLMSLAADRLDSTEQVIRDLRRF
jgi:hypothetical protein